MEGWDESEGYDSEFSTAEFACRLLLVTMETDQQIVNPTNQEGVHLTRTNPNTGFEYVDKYTGSTDSVVPFKCYSIEVVKLYLNI